MGFERRRRTHLLTFQRSQTSSVLPLLTKMPTFQLSVRQDISEPPWNTCGQQKSNRHLWKEMTDVYRNLSTAWVYFSAFPQHWRTTWPRAPTLSGVGKWKCWLRKMLRESLASRTDSRSRLRNKEARWSSGGRSLTSQEDDTKLAKIDSRGPFTDSYCWRSSDCL